MNKKINNFGKSMKPFKIVGMTFVIAFAVFVTSSEVKAESPNILAGENLMLGTQSQGVVVLQGLLSELGYLKVPAGIPFGYYGPLTKNAVSRYQASLNVAPAVGYYGPLTKVAMYSDFENHGYLRLLNW